MHQRNVVSTSTLKALAVLTGLAILGCVAVAALIGAGVWPKVPGALFGLALAAGILVIALVAIVLQILAARPERELIEPALEMSTLTFPPAPRVQRPPLPRA